MSFQQAGASPVGMKEVKSPVLVTLEPPSGTQVPVLGSAGNTSMGDDPSTGTWDPEGRSCVTSTGLESI